MEITKSSGKFNTYKIEVSYGELVAMENALQDSHSGPIADELFAGIQWYLAKLPLPGEEKTDKEGEEGGMGAEGEEGMPMPADSPMSDVDQILPAPPVGDEMGGEEAPPMGGEEHEVSFDEPPQGFDDLDLDEEPVDLDFKSKPKHESRLAEAKTYIVYDGTGKEVGMIKAGSHNAAEKKAKAKHGENASVSYTEV